MKKTTINPATVSNEFNYFMLNNRTFYGFENFLIREWSKQNDGQFLSVANYLAYVRKIAKTLGCTEQQFLSASLQQLKIWAIQIQDKPLFRSYDKEFRRDLNSGFKAFIAYCRFLLGLVSF